MHITMTTEQTALYLSHDEAMSMPMMAMLREQAQRMADETGKTIEIWTADDAVLVDARGPA